MNAFNKINTATIVLLAHRWWVSSAHSGSKYRYFLGNIWDRIFGYEPESNLWPHKIARNLSFSGYPSPDWGMIKVTDHDYQLVRAYWPGKHNFRRAIALAEVLEQRTGVRHYVMEA